MIVETLPQLPPLKFWTQTRSELIAVSAFLARAFDPKLFLDPQNVPYVFVSGSGDIGKSLVIEAMMRQIIGHSSLRIMLDEKTPQTHFLEKAPNDALDKCLIAKADVKGRSVFLGFDRTGSFRFENTMESIVSSFKHAARMSQKQIPDHEIVGAIFSSDDIVNGGEPWLHVSIRRNSYGPSRESRYPWGRVVEVIAVNDVLAKSARFQAFCRVINEYYKYGLLRTSELGKANATCRP